MGYFSGIGASKWASGSSRASSGAANGAAEPSADQQADFIRVGGGASSKPIIDGHRSWKDQVESVATFGAKLLFNPPRALLGVGLALAAVGSAVGLAAIAAGLVVVTSPFWGSAALLRKRLHKPELASTGPIPAPQSKKETNAWAHDADKRFNEANERMVSALMAPPKNGRPSRLGTSEDVRKVLDRLAAHGKDKGLERQQIAEWVTAGESIARALEEQPAGSKRLTLKDAGGQTVEIKPGVYTARALAWYMAAQAARQDIERENALTEHPQLNGLTDLAASGSYVMKDPGNKIYKFLRAAPSCAARMSTHFADRQDGHTDHWVGGLLWTLGRKKEQHGIEDYCSQMPGKGGTLLFEKLKPSAEGGDSELFMKFESAGCPPYFQASQPHYTLRDSLHRVRAALKRNLKHVSHYRDSQKAGGEKPKKAAKSLKLSPGHGKTVAKGAAKRTEHAHKDYLDDAGIYQEFLGLMGDAAKQGVIPKRAGLLRRSVKLRMKEGVKASGLKFIKDQANELQEKLTQSHATAGVKPGAKKADLQTRAALYDKLFDLQMKIAIEESLLGFQSDMHGIARRGAETHVSLSKDWSAPSARSESNGSA